MLNNNNNDTRFLFWPSIYQVEYDQRSQYVLDKSNECRLMQLTSFMNNFWMQLFKTIWKLTILTLLVVQFFDNFPQISPLFSCILRIFYLWPSNFLRRKIKCSKLSLYICHYYQLVLYVTKFIIIYLRVNTSCILCDYLRKWMVKN